MQYCFFFHKAILFFDKKSYQIKGFQSCLFFSFVGSFIYSFFVMIPNFIVVNNIQIRFCFFITLFYFFLLSFMIIISIKALVVNFGFSNTRIGFFLNLWKTVEKRRVNTRKNIKLSRKLFLVLVIPYN